MTYRYRVAVHRCRSCKGKGVVKRPISLPEPVVYMMYKHLLDRGALAVTQQCRSCDGTGRTHRWTRR